MTTKRNLATLVIVILVIAVAILSFTVAQSGITSLGVNGSPTPTIVAPQSHQDGVQLAWDCPTCPH